MVRAKFDGRMIVHLPNVEVGCLDCNYIFLLIVKYTLTTV